MTSEPQPAAKRPRLGTTEPHPDEELYFVDGNVILHCENTLFRVHRGVLSLNSEVFKDMFALGTDQTEKDLEGCPCIDLSDKADDVRRFLHCIYKRDYFRPGHFTEYRVIESLLRISTKYLVQSLRSELIEHLKAYYPSTLEEFRDGYTKHYSLFNHKAPYHSLLAVNMAREFDIPIILPAALYYCCEPPYNKIADGIEDSDGDLVKLCHSDQLLCLTAQRYISSDKLTILNEFLLSQEPSEDCIDPDGCRREMATILADLSAEITDITVFSASPPSTEYDPRLCGSCQEDWSSREMVGYYKMWIELPARFGLPSWNELATLADET